MGGEGEVGLCLSSWVWRRHWVWHPLYTQVGQLNEFLFDFDFIAVFRVPDGLLSYDN